MYHYVRPGSPELPNFLYLSLDDFRAQLDYFCDAGHLMSRDEFLAALRGHAPRKDGIVLTFDDGLADHYEFVLPELQRRNVLGVFYVTTGVYAWHKLLDVHRIHLLLGAAPSTELMEALGRIVTPDMLSHDHVEEFHKITYHDQKQDGAARRFKQVMNYLVSYDWRARLLDELMRQYFKNTEGPFDTFYLRENQIAEMQEAGMIVGSHSISHPVFSKLSESEQWSEIAESFLFLEKVTGGLSVRTFCYPYGGFESFTPITEALLGKAGCEFAFNVEPRDISADDLRARPQALPRYDCNLFPHGAVRSWASSELGSAQSP